MSKNRFPLYFIGLIGMGFLFLTACENDNDVVIDAFNNGSGSRDLIVVISDLHLGADLSYAEINDNREPLKVFLEKIRTSHSVKELVVAGDMLDEWYVPATTDTYNGKDQADFVKRIASTNNEVIGKFNQIIQDGKNFGYLHSRESRYGNISKQYRSYSSGYKSDSRCKWIGYLFSFWLS